MLLVNICFQVCNGLIVMSCGWDKNHPLQVPLSLCLHRAVMSPSLLGAPIRGKEDALLKNRLEQDETYALLEWLSNGIFCLYKRKDV